MKNKKVLSRILNILTIVIAVIVLVIAISAISSAKKGYTSMFGVAGIAVVSDSMEGDNKDSFNKGDLIYIKILEESDVYELTKGDVITFEALIDGKPGFNTHRIVEVHKIVDNEGKILNISFTTKGDKSLGIDTVPVSGDSVIGKYTGTRIPGLGAVTEFIQSPTGFMVLVVVPSFLVLIYALARVILNFKKYHKEKVAVQVSQQVGDLDKIKEQIAQEEREKIKAELMAEMQAKSEQTKNSTEDNSKLE